MKSLRKRLEEISRKTSLRLDIIQQDYLLSWILVGLFEHPLLKAELIFKGGTCLKKCYFGEYRFSEDLDFSAPPYLPKGDLLLGAIRKACESAEKKMNVYAPIRLLVERYEESKPHPEGQEAFKIRAQFSWQKEPLTTVMVEISRDESLLFPPLIKPILHDYGEQIETQVATYSLEEIILEKLRAILQHTKKLHEREWSRSRARDYYDLACIFDSFGESLSLDAFFSKLQQKCMPKEVNFEGIESFFDSRLVHHVSTTWSKWLGPLVPQLPECDKVMEKVRIKLEQLFQTQNVQ